VTYPHNTDIEELYRTLKRNLNLMRELDDQIDGKFAFKN
jgi:hypothetical protein